MLNTAYPDQNKLVAVVDEAILAGKSAELVKKNNKIGMKST